MKYDWLDGYLLSLPGAEKDYKPQWGWFRYMLRGRLFAACSQNSRTADCTNHLVYIEMIGCLSCFHINLHIGCIFWYLVILVRKLHPFTLDGCTFCNCLILCIAVCIRILQLQEKLIRCIPIKVHHIGTKAIFFSWNKCSWV